MPRSIPLFPPLSASFVDFLARSLDPDDFVFSWSDQVTESLVSNIEINNAAQMRLQRLATDARAQRHIDRAYEWLSGLAYDPSDLLDQLHEKFDFFLVVGAPRSGGTYLVAEALRAYGHDPLVVPTALAHDGFPESRPFHFSRNGNSWLRTLMTLSEYLTMAEIYFGSTIERRTTIPKKMVKCVYSGHLFRRVFNRGTSTIVTVRHPLDSCLSVLEKSGGWPSNRPGRRWSQIERWVTRDLEAFTGREEVLNDGNYAQQFIKYWEIFYVQLGLSGILREGNFEVLAYDTKTYEDKAAFIHAAGGGSATPARFVELGKRHSFGKDATRIADRSIKQVISVWKALGLTFPRIETRF